MSKTDDAAFAAGMQVILHTAVYAGVPCGVEAFNAAAEVLTPRTESKP